jgi:hypothetical protein
VAELKTAWDKAQLYEKDPAQFYKWLGEVMSERIIHEPVGMYQRITSARELLDARKKGWLQFSGVAEKALKGGKKDYWRKDESEKRYLDPLYLLEVPAGQL